jgi:hypothetical protein
MLNRTEYHLRSSRYLTVALAGMASFATLGLFMIFGSRGPRWSIVVPLIGVLSVVLFGGLGLALLVRLVSPHPAIYVDESGIAFRSVPFLSGHLRFEEIDRITAVTYGQAAYVELRPKDPTSFIRTQPWVFRWLLRSISRAGNPVCLALVGVAKSSTHRVIAAELRTLIKARTDA